MAKEDFLQWEPERVNHTSPAARALEENKKCTTVPTRRKNTFILLEFFRERKTWQKNKAGLMCVVRSGPLASGILSYRQWGWCALPCMHACMRGVEQRWKTSLTAEHIREELKTLRVLSVLLDAHCKPDISGRSTQQGDNMKMKFFSSFYCHGDRKGEGKSECLFEMLQISIHSSSCSLALDANLVILVPTYTTYSVAHTWLSLSHENIIV